MNDSATAFRAEAREWLRSNVPRSQRPTDGDAMREFDLDWQRTQYEGGWAGVSWPSEYGGRGLTLVEQMIWAQEYALAEAPYAGCCYIGLNHGGPTLLAHGTEAQQAQHLPLILRGDAVWCQGFSEPDAGSDLAAIRTRGDIDGDTLVVNGQKVWTSYGHFADYQELLIRTEPELRHGGLSWVVCDMRAPGVEVRPIQNMARNSHFCEVFYDEVRIPLSNVVGGVNRGWEVAQTTFSFERGPGFMAEQLELARTVESVWQLAQSCAATGDSDVPWREIGRARAEVAALGAMVEDMVDRQMAGETLTADGSLVRIFHSELVQRVHRLAVEILGDAGLEFHDAGERDGWTGAYLRSFAATIGGGTSDIHRNIVGERLLGLPREARS